MQSRSLKRVRRTTTRPRSRQTDTTRMKGIDPMPTRIYIFDTTLRDGEQSPGASMNVQEKIEIARQLERLGVDVIEAGFPISSPGDFQAVQEVCKVIKN